MFFAIFALFASGEPLLLRSADDPLRPGKVILQICDPAYLEKLEATVVTDTIGDLQDVVANIQTDFADRFGAKAILLTPLQTDTLVFNPISLTNKALKDLNKKGRTSIDVTSGETVLVPGILGFLSPGFNGIKMEQLPITSEWDLYGIFKSSYEDTDPFIGEPLVKELMKLIKV